MGFGVCPRCQRKEQRFLELGFLRERTVALMQRSLLIPLQAGLTAMYAEKGQGG